jgi:hypothetical protein
MFTYDNGCSIFLSTLLDSYKLLSQILSNISAIINEQFHWTVQGQQYKFINLKWILKVRTKREWIFPLITIKILI